MLVLDTEDNSRADVTIINFYDGVNHHTFTGKELKWRALNWLRSQPKQICWAVNAEYDIINLIGFEWIGKLITLQYVASGLMRGFYKEGPITFLDTLRHWALSVERMGKQLGYLKLEMPHLGCDCEKCVEYCRRDCEVAFKFISEMMARYEWLGLTIKSTLPSMAMQLFRNMYRGEFDLLPDGILKIFKDAYYGGRVEMFYKGVVTGKTNHYDVNSLFPSVMLNHDFPVLASWYKTKKPDYTKAGAAKGFAEIPKHFIPCLPVRHYQELLFPYGNVSGVWTYPEIRYLLEQGGGFVADEAVEFSDVEQPFNEYVKFCYDHRLRSDNEIDKTFWKLMLNSLYGKFGQTRGITTITIDKGSGKAVERTISSRSKTSNIIWSAYVTSYARVKLHKYLIQCSKVYYTDTDSLFTPDEIETSTELGDLKLEGVRSLCEFVGNKIYMVDGKAKAKGVREAFASDFIRTGRAIYRKPARYREAMRNQVKANYWYEVEKKHNAEYTKRIVTGEGFTEPWEFSRYKKFMNDSL